MTIKIKKLDKRNTGFSKFKYSVTSTSLYSQEFYEIRKWMWDTWGASKELKDVAKGMSKKAGHDFAATKHKGLPEKVKKK